MKILLDEAEILDLVRDFASRAFHQRQAPAMPNYMVAPSPAPVSLHIEIEWTEVREGLAMVVVIREQPAEGLTPTGPPPPDWMTDVLKARV